MKPLSIECPNLTCIINQSWPGCEAKILGILCTCYILHTYMLQRRYERTYERTDVHRAVKIYDDRMDGRLHRPWSYTI